MTTRPDEQQEPSMEEILSSIRRIIADEGGDEDPEQDAAKSRAERAERGSDALAPGAQDDADDDVLELTEVVREEAEVIELDQSLAQAQPIDRRPFEAPSDGLGDDRPGPAEPDPGAWARAAGAGDSPAEAGAEPPGAPGAQSPMEMRDHEMEDHQTAMHKDNGSESLVSDRAAGAATGAFAKLSQAIQRTPPEVAIADGSGRTVEQFVEDMIRPMLRDWLDEHLAPLVERIVQKEIKKIVRRADDD